MASKKTPTKKQTQTKKQTPTKAKGKKARAPSLPNGYKVIGRAPNWEFIKHPVLEGVRGEAREVTMDKGTKKERDVRNMIVESEELGAVTVWESSGLKDLFDQTEEGDNICIEYLGEAPAKKGQNPMKLFACGRKE